MLPGSRARPRCLRGARLHAALVALRLLSVADRGASDDEGDILSVRARGYPGIEFCLSLF